MNVHIRFFALFVLVISFLTTSTWAVVEPVESTIMNRRHIRLRWDAVANAQSYEWQIGLAAAASPFVTPVAIGESSTSENIVTSGISWATNYVWRVRGIYNGTPLTWSATHTFSTRALPTTLVMTATYGTGSPQAGVTLTNHCSYVLGYDLDGGLMYCMTAPGSVENVELMADERVILNTGGRCYVLDLDGNTIWVSPVGYSVSHDCSIMPDGSVLMLCKESKSIVQGGVTRTWVGDRIVQMNMSTNAVIWEWSTFTGYSTLDYDTLQSNYWNDWTHCNSLLFVESQNAFYLSSRHLSRVTKIDYATKKITWNMGFALASGQASFGDNLFSYQHAPEFLANGNILLFDNGNRRDHVARTASTGYSRAVELQLSGAPVNAASIVWQWRLPTYTDKTGDVDRLANGNTLVTSTASNGIFEVNSAGQEVWRLQATTVPSCGGAALPSFYRSQRAASLFHQSCFADLDGSGEVDSADVGIVLLDTGSCQGCMTDLDNSGEVDSGDVGLTLLSSGPCQ